MQIGYIDFSKEERDKVLATLKLLTVSSALDELGIGRIRDAFANKLFPGLSTIQTRAKYYVIIPYLFKKAEMQNFETPQAVRKWINDSEDKIVKTLVNNSQGASGIIGSDSLKRGRTVKLKPSFIYWTGLRMFDILQNQSYTINSVCDIIYGKAQRNKEKRLNINDMSFDDEGIMNGDTEIFSPLSIDYDFQNKASIELTFNEAEFLWNKITTAEYSRYSLLSFLLTSFSEYESFDFIPVESLPNFIRTVFINARLFSDFIQGAYLRYNIIFSRNSGSEDQNMIQGFDEWKSKTFSPDINLDEIFSCAEIDRSDKLLRFCKGFLNCVIEDDWTRGDKLIISWEKEVKASRAKLSQPENYPYVSVHRYKLDYRFNTARIIIRDILTALKRGEAYV